SYGLRSAVLPRAMPGLSTLVIGGVSLGLVVAGILLGRSQPQLAFVLLLFAAILLRLQDTLPDFAAGLGLIVAWIVAGLATPSQALAGFASLEWVFVLAILCLSGAIARSGLLLRVGLLLVRR